MKDKSARKHWEGSPSRREVAHMIESQIDWLQYSRLKQDCFNQPPILLEEATEHQLQKMLAELKGSVEPHNEYIEILHRYIDVLQKECKEHEERFTKYQKETGNDSKNHQYGYLLGWWWGVKFAYHTMEDCLVELGGLEKEEKECTT